MVLVAIRRELSKVSLLQLIVLLKTRNTGISLLQVNNELHDLAVSLIDVLLQHLLVVKTLLKRALELMPLILIGLTLLFFFELALLDLEIFPLLDLNLLLLDLLVKPHTFEQVLDVASEQGVVGLILVPKLVVLLDEAENLRVPWIRIGQKGLLLLIEKHVHLLH